jgi:CcmD family protein
MNYLFAAYTAIWIILAVYLVSIHSREKKLREEVRRLEQQIRDSKFEIRD